MPFGDRTGPEGKGAQTGRGLGDCNTNKDSDSSEDSNVNNAGVAGVAGFLGRGFRNAISRGNGNGNGNGSGRGNGRGRNRR
jgi:hypothetical protein